MKLKTIYKSLVSILMVIFSISCTEEISFEIEELESALVIEATITNELKTQEIQLSRTYAFEDNGPTPEIGATITIKTGNSIINFEEVEPGLYHSKNPFNATINIDYVLDINTTNGKTYTSNPVQLTDTNPSNTLYAEREVTNQDEDGVSIYLNSFDSNSSKSYYRFEYEETYKIIPPYWATEDLEIINPNYPECSVELVPRNINTRVCFGNVNSNKIILASTLELNENNIERFLIHQLERNNYILTHRYSILVRQYAISQEAYTYYETLRDLSGEGNLFSQNQPGFFSGNITSQNNSQEKVLGFFDVANVREDRIFFNYQDIFPEEPQPHYISPCTRFAPTQFEINGCGPLIYAIRNGTNRFYLINDKPTMGKPGPYILVPEVCGDCTTLPNSSTHVPDFWIE